VLVRTIVGAAVVVAAVIAVAVSGCLSPASPDGQALAAPEPPVVDCATRAEPSIASFDPERDIVRGPFALVTVARDLPRLSRASYRPRGGRLAGVKLPVGLRDGHTATLSVAPAQRAHVALMYREATRDATSITEGDDAVSFRPCPAATPAFSGGTVGPVTGWAGELMVTGPRCVRLELRVDGERRRNIRLPLGRRCRDSAATTQAKEVRPVGCERRSGASFPGAFSRPGTLVVGPAAFVGALGARSASPDELRRLGWWKSQLLLRPGHSVTVSIKGRSRSLARLAYAPIEDGEQRFGRLPHTLRFVSCETGERSGSDVDGAPVTFWSGGFVLSRSPVCVKLDITVDGGRPESHTLAFGTRRC
jgi:hypothetical protein